MTFEIEKLKVNATLNEYEWGKWRQIDLFGVIRIRLDILKIINIIL